MFTRPQKKRNSCLRPDKSILCYLVTVLKSDKFSPWKKITDATGVLAAKSVFGLVESYCSDSIDTVFRYVYNPTFFSFQINELNIKVNDVKGKL